MVIIKYKSKEEKIGEMRSNKHGTPMKLIDYKNIHDCTVEFQDEYKYIFDHANYQNFLKGQIANPYDRTVHGVGMLGSGKYKARYTLDRMAKEYNIWQNILERCYVDNKKHPAYYNIATVCNEWHNYQNFAEWYEEQQYYIPNGDRLEIDKDILIQGNKCYSPDTCILIPQKINMLFTNMTRKDGLPNGITKTLNGKKFKATYNTQPLGNYESLKEAYNAYAKKKEEAIKRKAEDFKEYLPQKVYDALIAYEVRIENDKNYQDK